MAAFSEDKRQALSRLIDSMPERLLPKVEAAFAQTEGAAAKAIVEDVAARRLDIAAMTLAFAPLISLFSGGAERRRGLVFPEETLRLVWREVRHRRPDAIAILHNRIRTGEAGASGVTVLNGLCADAASILREVHPADVGLKDEESCEALIACFELAPLARRAISQLPAWTSRMGEEEQSALKLLFKDAAVLRPDAAVHVLEMLMGRLDHPCRILRLVSVLAHGAPDAMGSRQELAGLCEQVIAMAEDEAADLADLGRGGESAPETDIARTLDSLALILTEIDLFLPPCGDWTARLTHVRTSLVGMLEAWFRDAERLVARALPLGRTPLAGRMSRLAPDLTAAPDARTVNQAKAVLRVISTARGLAPVLGCEALRRHVCEVLDESLHRYAEDLLVMVEKDAAGDRGFAFLEIVADMLRLVSGETSADLLRRRTAVLANQPPQAMGAA